MNEKLLAALLVVLALAAFVVEVKIIRGDFGEPWQRATKAFWNIKP